MAYYKYGVIVETGELKPGLADATTEEISKATLAVLSGIINKVEKACDELEGGRWEVVSHDLTRMDRHLIVTFVVRSRK